MGKDAFFFSHDYGARNDPKLTKVLMKLGQAGKGVYWDLVEMLYEQTGKLLLSEIEAYAFALRTDSDLITSLINDFDLFKNDGNVFWSDSVLTRLQKRVEKSEKAKESISKRWDKTKNNTNVQNSDTNVLPNDYDSNTIKERKGNKNKGKDNVFIPPLVVDVRAYFKDNGYSDTAADRAFNHYDSGNWHDTNGNPVVNWKQKLRTNWFKDENKIKANTGGFVE